MKFKQYASSNHICYHICYHITWIPKYRKKILSEIISIELKKLILQKIDTLSLHLIALEIMSDHIHLFIQTPPTLSVCNIVKHIIIRSFLQVQRLYKNRLIIISLRYSPSTFSRIKGNEYFP